MLGAAGRAGASNGMRWLASGRAEAVAWRPCAASSAEARRAGIWSARKWTFKAFKSFRRA